MIPLFKPSVTDAEIEAVTRVLKSGWWGLGPETEKFEQEFAEFVGVKYAVAVNSATSALELAARACGITGKTVAVPALTFVSTAQAMQHAGNRVVFVDINDEDLCIKWDDPHIAQADAVVPVWFGGSVFSPGGEIFNEPWPEVPIIEDCAHAAGATGAGLSGWAACWSFQAVKNLATGDGGMVTTDDPEVAAKVRTLRWCGIDKSTWERDQGKYGWNYSIPADGEKMHMNDLAAALGRVQLSRLKEMNERRYEIASQYYEMLNHNWWLSIDHPIPGDSHHLCVIRIAAGKRNRFIDWMLANGVSAGVHYKPLTHYPHLFPGEHHVPVTERVWQELVTIPLYPDLTDAEIAQIIDTIQRFPA